MTPLTPCLRCGRLGAGSYCRAHARPLGSTHAWRTLRVRVLARDRWTCQECGAPASDVDHVLPRAYGGPDTAPNLLALCARCNRGKRAR
jgi:5-methylcytosine-specific restriction endonuclease McrA